MEEHKHTCAFVYCACGKLSSGLVWREPTTTLTALLKTLTERGITQIVFVKITCPDCYQAAGRGVCANREEV